MGCGSTIEGFNMFALILNEWNFRLAKLTSRINILFHLEVARALTRRSDQSHNQPLMQHLCSDAVVPNQLDS